MRIEAADLFFGGLVLGLMVLVGQLIGYVIYPYLGLFAYLPCLIMVLAGGGAVALKIYESMSDY